MIKFVVMRPTKQQKRLLDFITSYTAKHGIAPSYREIMKQLGYASTSTVALHIDGLIERGYLQKRPNVARSIDVVGMEDCAVLKRAQKAMRKATAEDKTNIIRALVMMGYYKPAEKLASKQ